METSLSSLIVDVRAGERLSISSPSDVLIELIKKSGQHARLRVIAPKDVVIKKKSVDEADASMA